jgi:hypothetical protein
VCAGRFWPVSGPGYGKGASSDSRFGRERREPLAERAQADNAWSEERRREALADFLLAHIGDP